MFILIFLITIIWIIPGSVRAAEVSVVEATTKISVCGDGLAEGMELCDDIDFRGQSCRSLGFFAGKLECDIACEFNTLECFGTAPTAQPTESPNPISGNTINIKDSEKLIPVNETFVEEIKSVFNTLRTGINRSLPLLNSLNPTLENIIQERVTPFISSFGIRPKTTVNLETAQIILKTWLESKQTHLQKNETKPDLGNEIHFDKCDFNADDVCNSQDLSILLFNIKI